MKKMINRLMLVCACTALTALVGCGSGDATSDSKKTEEKATTVSEDGREMIGNMYVEGLPIVKEPETFKILLARGANDNSKSQNDKLIMQMADEATNIKIEWDEVSTDINEKLNLLFAAGTGLPDAVMSWPSESVVTQNTSRLTHLTEDMMTKFAPNITAQATEYLPDGIAAFAKADGNIYSLPSGPYAEKANSVTSVPLIRQDWLDAVGMEMPTTTDELTEVLRAFKTKDPNGNGLADEIPVSFCQSNWAAKIFCFAGPWGIAGRTANDIDNYYTIKEGVVAPTVNTDNFKDFLRYMHTLADEELLDIEGFSMTQSQFLARQKEGVLGMYHTWAADDPNVWAPVPVLSAPGYEGQGRKQGEEGYRTASMNGFMITSACENPETLLRWWDHLHSTPELKRIARDGEEGILWKGNEDGTATVVTPTEYPDGINDNTTLNYTIAWRGNGPVMFGDEVAAPDMTVTPPSNDALRYQYVELYKDYLNEEFLPQRPIDPKNEVQKNFIQTELEAYLNGFIAESVVNGLSDEQWEAHLQQLDALQLNEWIQWQQDYLDGKF